jgi:hypothetical protein
MTMMICDVSRQYHAERIRTAAEQRCADEHLGMMAAGVSRLWRRATRPVRARHGSRTGRGGHPAMPGDTIGG